MGAYHGAGPSRPPFNPRDLREMLRERGYSEEAVKAILDWYR